MLWFLSCQITNVEICMQGCAAVHKAARACNAASREFGDADVCAAVVVAMTDHADNEGLVQLACKAMSELAQNGYATIIALGKAGACQAVVNALDKFIDVESTAEPCCVAISKLAYTPTDKDNGHAKHLSVVVQSELCWPQLTII
eukprot:4943-Heterococcus_DN1.PRE.4